VLPHLARPGAEGAEKLKEAVALRERLGWSMAQLVMEDSIKLSVVEVLFHSFHSIHRRIVVWGSETEDTLSGWHMYHWDDLRSQDRHAWKALGWDYHLWAYGTSIGREVAQEHALHFPEEEEEEGSALAGTRGTKKLNFEVSIDTS
jgi:hypothetical protein